MHKIDDSFRKRRSDSIARRRWQIARSVGTAVVVIAAVGGGIFLALQSGLVTIGPRTATPPPLSESDFVETQAFALPFVDLAGDPMRINFGVAASAEPMITSIARPLDFPEQRGSGAVELLIDTMISSGQRLMITLPSSPQDFAFYQAQRAVPASASPPPPLLAATPALDLTEIDAAGGWGETLSGDQLALPTATQTRIANTTSLAFLRAETERYTRQEDVIVRALLDRDPASLVQENGFTLAEAQKAQAALATELQVDHLLAGDLVALRGVRQDNAGGALQLVQLSLYRGSQYLGSLALSADGSLGPSVDPWVADDLVSYSADAGAQAPSQQYRLLDAVYSTAIRNGVPTSVTGETIMLLSRSYDLNVFVDPMDQLVLAYAAQGDAGDLSRILYAAITGPDRHIECFVYRASSKDEFACFDPDSAHPPGGGANGLFTPVSGVMTSGFGPRMHPIFKEVRVHKGIDWAAPTGTPVMAALAGKVVSAGTAGGYGNMVRLSHSDGTETRYAHLSRFADGLAAGQQVAAGNLIGYVGTTGNSTGPHLHFELYRGGDAVNPLAESTTSTGGGPSVAALVDRIISVESGGNATARNPLSTATGGGQFISETWLRMIRTYRPDLAQSLSQTEILDLRLDPTISREMVTELAREGEAYLKARGLEPSAGRLYLAHFLGMDGAYRVLTADVNMALVDLLGQKVIDANPFLTGQTVAYVINWADGKMSGARSGSRPAATPVAPVDPEFNTYRQSIRSLVAMASPTSD